MLDLLVLVLILSVLTACVLIQRKKFKAAKSPEAAYNRSVSWYQTIMKLPVAERAQQIEAWSNYTKQLPEPKNKVRPL